MKEVFINGTFIVEDKKVNEFIGGIKKLAKEKTKYNSISVTKFDLGLEKGKYKAGRLFKSINGGYYWLVISVADMIYARTGSESHVVEDLKDLLINTPDGKSIVIGNNNIFNHYFDEKEKCVVDWNGKNKDDEYEYIMDLDPDVFEKFLISIN